MKHNSKPRVALYMDHGCRGGAAVRWAEMLYSAPEFEFEMLDATDVKAGRLMEFDCLVMPGGGGFERYDDCGEEGFAKIRDFIRQGGKYLGTCAGMSVMLNEEKRIRMIPFKRDGVWERGGVNAILDISPRFEELTGVKAEKRMVMYHNGPTAISTEPVPDCKAEVIATFDCDGKPDQDAISPMRGKPAVIWAEYGKGRMFIFAVHPESWARTHDLIRGAFKALLGIAPEFAEKRLSPNFKRVYFNVEGMDKECGLKGRIQALLEETKGSDRMLVPYKGERLEGPFPLLLTPWTEDAHVDIPVLIKEAEYVDAAGAGGMIWPSAGERKEIVEAGDYERGLDALVARSVEKGREFKAKITAVVSGADTAQGVEQMTVVEKLAQKYNAHLVVLARPGDDCTDQESIFNYYCALAKVTTQTVIVQTFNGDKCPQPSVETLVRLAQEHSHFSHLKEESPGLTVNSRMEELLKHREIKGIFSGWGGKGWVYQGTRIGTCGVISQRAEYAPLFVKIWERMKAGADASDPELAKAFTSYLYMANLGDIFSKWGDDAMRGPHLYVMERLGIFRNRLTREDGKVTEWAMTDKEKAEVDARLKYIGLLP